MANVLTFLMGLDQLTHSRVVEECRTWLEQNPNDEYASLVKGRLRRDAEGRLRETFLMGLDQLTYSRVVEECRTWLEQNPNDEYASLVKGRLRDAEALKARSLEQVLTEYPVLTDTTYSLPYDPKNHSHADIEEMEISFDLEKSFIEDGKFWKAPFVGESRDCDSETEAQFSAVSLLRGILKGMGLDGIVDVVQNRTLAGKECDVLLVYKPNRLPFAVIEVKKPANSIEGLRLIFRGSPRASDDGESDLQSDDGESDLQSASDDGESDLQSDDGESDLQNLVAGEVFDEMKAIQLFGFDTVVGMISTGNQWRTVGLLRDDGNPPPAFDGDIQQKLCALKQNDATEDVTEMEEAPTLSPGESVLKFDGDSEEANVERKIWADDIVPPYDENMNIDQLLMTVKVSGGNIVSKIVRFVCIACVNLHEFVQRKGNELNTITIGKKMPCRVLTDQPNKTKNIKAKNKVFAFGTVRPVKLELDVYNERLQKINVVHHLGFGASGNVCLGISDTGASCCAVKFYHDKDRRQEFAEAELENWKKVYSERPWFKTPRVLDVSGGKCLVMQYFYPIAKEERGKLLGNGTIRLVLKKFVDSGYFHDEIKWRHFRLLKENSRSADDVVMVDLGQNSLREAGSESDIESWIQEAVKILGDKARAVKGPESSDPQMGPESSDPQMKTPPQNRNKKPRLV